MYVLEYREDPFYSERRLAKKSRYTQFKSIGLTLCTGGVVLLVKSGFCCICRQHSSWVTIAFVYG